MFKVNDFGKKYKCFAEVLQRIIFYGRVLTNRISYDSWYQLQSIGVETRWWSLDVLYDSLCFIWCKVIV